MKEKDNRSITNNLDEGLNVTTRLPYTDAISTKASEETIKKSKKKQS